MCTRTRTATQVASRHEDLNLALTYVNVAMHVKAG